MATFSDAAGVDWQLRVTVGAINRVRESTGVELDKCLEDNMAVLHEMLVDICKVVDVVYSICRQQAVERNVSAEEFGERMVGDSVTKATDALIESLIDFFPKRQSEILKATMRKMKTVEDALAQKTMKLIQEFDDVDVDQLLNSVTSSQES